MNTKFSTIYYVRNNCQYKKSDFGVFCILSTFSWNGEFMDHMIGVRIRERRKKLNITGTQIKEKTGISTGNLSDIENGKSLPSSAALIQLSQILECSIDYILLGKSRNSELYNFPDLTASERQLLEHFHILSEEDKEEIILLTELKYNRTIKSQS